MKVVLVRGSYLNLFEGQNYEPLQSSVKLLAIGSLHTIHTSFPFPTMRLPSLADGGVPRWIANRTIGDRQNLWGLQGLVQDADIVHTADPHYYYSYQLAQMRHMGVIQRLIATSWETIPYNNESTSAKRRIKQFSMRYIDHFLCHTERAKRSLLTEGVPQNRISVIPLGVDLQRFYPHGKNRQREEFTVLFAGRNVAEKGVDDLATLELLGNSTRFIRAHDTPYHLMPSLYRSVDCFIHLARSTPTWEEQYGMVLIEALASGLPIVAYDSGSVAEVVGDAGILVREGSIQELARSVELLHRNRSLRDRLGRAARKRAVQFFDRNRFAQRLLRLYKKNRYTS